MFGGRQGSTTKKKTRLTLDNDFPIGKGSWWGLRIGPMDLMNIQRQRKSMEYTIKGTNEKFVPHVIEPSFCKVESVHWWRSAECVSRGRAECGSACLFGTSRTFTPQFTVSPLPKQARIGGEGAWEITPTYLRKIPGRCGMTMVQYR